jgi:hypothetical protein
VDTTVPPPVVTAPADGSLTNDVTPTYSGTAEPGSTVTVFVDGAVIGTTTADASGNWSLTLPMALPDGAHTVKAWATDVAGNTRADSNTNTFTVDTHPPAAPVVMLPAHNSLTNDPTPTYSGTAEANSTVTVFVDSAVIGTVIASTSGNWNLTQSAVLPDGTHTVKARATDMADNTSTESTTKIFTVDTTPPATPVVVAPAHGSLTNDPTPEYSGTAEPGSRVTVLVDGSFMVTVIANASGNWNLTQPTALPDGAHTVRAWVTDGAGNTSADSNTNTFTVDTTALAAPVVVAPAHGSFTNNSTPIYSGTAEALSRVTVIVDGAAAGTVFASASGNWSLMQPTELSSEAHTVKARASDAAGNTSADSNTNIFTVSTTPPDAPVVVAPARGSFTNDTTPEYSGTAEVGSTVAVIVDSTSVGITTTSASGSWSLMQPTALSQGPHTVEAQATDAAGNVSAASSAVSFTVDSVAPEAPVLSGPAAFVNSATPPISGTAEPRSIVSVSLDGRVAGTTAASMEGTWSLTSETALAEGPHIVTATATDAAGNTSLAFSPQTFVVDTIAPDAPIVSSPAPGDVYDMKDPIVTGIAEASTKVTVILDGKEIGTEEVSTTGSWSFPLAEDLPVGAHSLAARSIDAAGNQSPLSASIPFTTDIRGHDGGCASAPTSSAGWVAAALGIGWLLCRERRRHVEFSRRVL